VTEPAADPGSGSGGVAAVPDSRSRARNRRSGWRVNWQIGVVVVVLFLVGGATLWLVRRAADHASRIVLPGRLLGLSRDSSPHAQLLDHNIETNARASTGDELGNPVAGIYIDSGGHGFAVVVGTPCTDGGCVIPTAQQLVHTMRAHGAADATAFSPGPDGGLLTCFSYTDQGRPYIQCSWIDQVTAAEVNFAGGYVSNLADAATKTRELRDAVEP
jgi:hypothetical protein